MRKSRLVTIAASGMAALVVLGSGACDRKDELAEAAKEVREAAKAATSQAAQQLDEAQVLVFSKQFVDAVQARDMESLKRLCTVEGSGEYREIMTCYYNAFAIENSQGADAARRFLAEEIAKPDNSPARAKALKALGEYFEAKGSLGTKEVAGLVLVVALEAKFPHRGGVLGAIIADKLGLLDMDSASATLPATMPTTNAALRP